MDLDDRKHTANGWYTANDWKFEYAVGDKVVIKSNVDDEIYPVGAICTIGSRSVRIYCGVDGHIANVYAIKEFPKAEYIEEQRLDYPYYERTLVNDKEFDDMFG